MSVTLQNQLAVPLVVPNAEGAQSVRFGANGSTTDTKVVSTLTSSVLTAIANGDLAITASTAGEVKVLDEAIGTGAPQNVAHGLGKTPTYVGFCVSRVPDTGYGGGSGTPYTITEGTHNATNVVVTVTAGIRFKTVVVG